MGELYKMADPVEMPFVQGRLVWVQPDPPLELLTGDFGGVHVSAHCKVWELSKAGCAAVMQFFAKLCWSLLSLILVWLQQVQVLVQQQDGLRSKSTNLFCPLSYCFSTVTISRCLFIMVCFTAEFL